MEDPAVFEEVHRFALELVHRAAPTGLRVDHVDGLYRARRIPAAAAGPMPRGPGHRPPTFFIVVEKILGAREALPPDWPVRGHDRLRVCRRRQQPVRGPAQREGARRHLDAVRPRPSRAAFLRRSGLPQQEAGDARNDVGRHQLARASAQSLLRAQPAFPRLHAVQPDLDAEGSDRLLPGVPDLRRPKRSRSASTTGDTSPRRSATRSGGRLAWPRSSSISSSGCCSSRRRLRRRKSAPIAPGSSGSFSRSPAPSRRKASKTRRCTCTPACCR